MQIICRDGTTIPCNDFEATDEGVLFYQESPSQQAESEDRTEDEEAEETLGRASGFVPIAELRFVLPDEMVQQQQQQPQRAASQRTHTQPPQQGGSMQHQQQLQQQSGVPPQTGGQ